MGLGTIAGVVALIVAGVASALAAGGWLWERSAREARTRLDAQRLNPVPKRVSFKDFEGLPQPVQRYFRTVLTDGQPVVASARIAHQGELKTVHLRPGGERGKARFRLGGPHPNGSWTSGRGSDTGACSSQPRARSRGSRRKVPGPIGGGIPKGSSTPLPENRPGKCRDTKIQDLTPLGDS